MQARSRLVRVAGLFVATVVAAACQAGPGATTVPTAATATTPPAATTAPAASMGVPSGAIVAFTATAGATPQLQGGATLVGLSGQTQVVIALVPPGSETFAATIQAGTCGSLNPEIVHRLTDVASGASATTLDVDIATLLATDYAINIVVPGSETESSLACGNIEPVAAP